MNNSMVAHLWAHEQKNQHQGAISSLKVQVFILMGITLKSGE